MPIESDRPKPMMGFEFNDTEDFFEPLIDALQSGQIQAEGQLSVNVLDRPELDENYSSSAFRAIQKAFRNKPDIVVAFGSEAGATEIPSAAWWYEGVIWEKSILWIAQANLIDEQRWKSITKSKTVQFPPDRPYPQEQLKCFDDVSLSLSDTIAWANTYGLISSGTPPRNTRGAGAKPSENWPKIEEFLQAEVDKNAVWTKWDDVWFSIQHLLRAPDDKNYRPQRYRKLLSHLQRNNPDLLKKIRDCILKPK